MINRLLSLFPKDKYFLLSVVFCLFFVPTIKISSGFYFCLEDIFLLLVLLKLILQRPLVLPFVKFSILVTLYICFTILINPNRLVLNEYFEIVKMIKLTVLVTLVYQVFNNESFNLDKLIKRIFLGLVAMNLFHYFNILSFNTYIEPFFDTDGIDLKYFGINTEGLPAAKRMLGTLGNPNNNSVLFLFFSSYFLATNTIDSILDYKRNYPFYLSFIMVLLCQSRTGILIIVGLILFFLIFQKFRWKSTFKFLFSISIISLFVFLVDTKSVSYFTNTEITIAPSEPIASTSDKSSSSEISDHSNASHVPSILSNNSLSTNTSIKGRLDMWKILIDMIYEKPVFGWGPNKNYIYSHSIYPENEMIFLVWKYGIIGFFLFSFLLLSPIFKSLDFIKQNKFYFYILLVVFVSGITNTPLSNPRIFGVFALILGVVLYQRKEYYSNKEMS
jgi:hypothetical protein